MRTFSRLTMLAALSGLAAAMAVTSPAQAQSTGHVPTITIDGVRQTTDLAGIHVWGWTADVDGPLTPLFIDISVDGGRAVSVLARKPLPDIVRDFPQYGANHGYDIVLPASASGHKVCMTAFSVNGGANKTGCQQMDDIVKFEPQAIEYDTAHAVIGNVVPEQLQNVSFTNGTDLEQSRSASDSRTVTDTSGWSDKVSASLAVESTLKVGVPFVAQGTLKVTASAGVEFIRNGSSTQSTTVSWNQPVLVPAHSRVDASVMIAHYPVSVPYLMGGPFRWRSGEWAWGTISGTFNGTSSTDVTVTMKQFNLDGSPAARAAQQPPAKKLTMSSAR